MTLLTWGWSYVFLLELGRRALTVSAVIGILLFARLFLRRAPRKILYTLWIFVLAALLLPILPEFKIETPLISERSMIARLFTIEADAGQDGAAVIVMNGGEIGSDSEGNDGSTSDEHDDKPLTRTEILFRTCGILWLCGALTVGITTVSERIRLSRALIGAIQVTSDGDAEENRCWLADGIRSGFVLGIFHPKIYLPSDCTDKEKQYQLVHESVHLRRRDNLWRLLGILCLAVYWFHPLVWLSFRLAVSDMEISCDEAVLQRFGTDRESRSAYAEMLVRFSAQKRRQNLFPTAFGEEVIKERIANIMTVKKTTAFTDAATMIFIALALCAMSVRLAAETVEPVMGETAELLMRSQQFLYPEKSDMNGYQIRYPVYRETEQMITVSFQMPSCWKEVKKTTDGLENMLFNAPDITDAAMIFRQDNRVAAAVYIYISDYRSDETMLSAMQDVSREHADSPEPAIVVSDKEADICFSIEFDDELVTSELQTYIADHIFLAAYEIN